MPHSGPRTNRRGSAVLVCWIVMMLEAFLVLILSGQATTLSRRSSGPAPAAPAGNAVVETPDERFRKAMLGTWEDDYRGHRVLTLNEDGSGVMVVEPEGLAAFTYAAKLTFHERWTVNDGTVRMDATGGQPALAVQMILKVYGSSATFRTEEITGARMILIDLADNTRFEWRRVKADQ